MVPEHERPRAACGVATKMLDQYDNQSLAGIVLSNEPQRSIETRSDASKPSLLVSVYCHFRLFRPLRGRPNEDQTTLRRLR